MPQSLISHALPTERLGMSDEDTEAEKPQQAATDISAAEEMATERPSAKRLKKLEESLVGLTAEKEAAEVRAEECFDKLRRLQADFENYQKMTKRELETITQLANEKLMVRLLTVLDALENAVQIKRINDPKAAEALHEGLKMVLREMKDALEAEGLAEIGTEGAPLDPRKHEVVTFVETTKRPENTVLRELRRGYTLKGTVIRPSLVEVAKQPKAKEESSGEQSQ